MKIIFSENYEKASSKIKDTLTKDRLIKLIIKIKNNPKIGKPMRYERKGTREVYISSFRLSYSYNKNVQTITLLDLYHKDEQ